MYILRAGYAYNTSISFIVSKKKIFNFEKTKKGRVILILKCQSLLIV